MCSVATSNCNPAALLNGQVDVGGADGGLRACGRRADHPADDQNYPAHARRTTTSEFHLCSWFRTHAHLLRVSPTYFGLTVRFRK